MDRTGSFPDERGPRGNACLGLGGDEPVGDAGTGRVGAEAAFLRDSQVPINMSVFATPLEHAAWRTKPSWAVIATEDRAFDLAMLRHMAERIGATVTEVAASHAAYLTQPDVVADTIHHAAQSAFVAVS